MAGEMADCRIIERRGAGRGEENRGEERRGEENRGEERRIEERTRGEEMEESIYARWELRILHSPLFCY